MNQKSAIHPHPNSCEREAKNMRLSISKQLELVLKDYRCEECLREENKSKLVYNQKRISIYDDLIANIKHYQGKIP